VSVTVRTAPLRDVRRGRRSGAAGCDAEGGYAQPDDGRGRGEPVWAGEFIPAAASPGDVRLTEVVLHRAADRDRDGHPELTDAVKERVLGVHAAELSGLDPDATRCGLAADMPAVSRPAQRELAAACELPAPWVPPGPVSQEMQRGRAQENGPWIPRLRLVCNPIAPDAHSMHGT
jgi:hypothetical protein